MDCFASGQNIIDLGFGLETRNLNPWGLEGKKRQESEGWQRCRGRTGVGGGEEVGRPKLLSIALHLSSHSKYTAITAWVLSVVNNRPLYAEGERNP